MREERGREGERERREKGRESESMCERGRERGKRKEKRESVSLTDDVARRFKEDLFQENAFAKKAEFFDANILFQLKVQSVRLPLHSSLVS